MKMRPASSVPTSSASISSASLAALQSRASESWYAFLVTSRFRSRISTELSHFSVMAVRAAMARSSSPWASLVNSSSPPSRNCFRKSLPSPTE